MSLFELIFKKKLKKKIKFYAAFGPVVWSGHWDHVWARQASQEHLNQEQSSVQQPTINIIY